MPSPPLSLTSPQDIRLTATLASSTNFGFLGSKPWCFGSLSRKAPSPGSRTKEGQTAPGQPRPFCGQTSHSILRSGPISVPCRGPARGCPTGMLGVASTLCHHPEGLSHNGLQSYHPETLFFPFILAHHQCLPAPGSHRDQPTLGNSPHFQWKGSGYWGTGRRRGQECRHRLTGKASLGCRTPISGHPHPLPSGIQAVFTPQQHSGQQPAALPSLFLCTLHWLSFLLPRLFLSTPEGKDKRKTQRK